MKERKKTVTNNIIQSPLPFVFDRKKNSFLFSKNKFANPKYGKYNKKKKDDDMKIEEFVYQNEAFHHESKQGSFRISVTEGPETIFLTIESQKKGERMINIGKHITSFLKEHLYEHDAYRLNGVIHGKKEIVSVIKIEKKEYQYYVPDIVCLSALLFCYILYFLGFKTGSVGFLMFLQFIFSFFFLVRLIVEHETKRRSQKMKNVVGINVISILSLLFLY